MPLVDAAVSALLNLVVLAGIPFLAYFGLIISTEAGSLIPHSDTAGVDYWIRLEALDGEKYDFLIEANPDASSETALGPTHPVAALVLGRKIGQRAVVLYLQPVRK